MVRVDLSVRRAIGHKRRTYRGENFLACVRRALKGGEKVRRSGAVRALSGRPWRQRGRQAAYRKFFDQQPHRKTDGMPVSGRVKATCRSGGPLQCRGAGSLRRVPSIRKHIAKRRCGIIYAFRAYPLPLLSPNSCLITPSTAADGFAAGTATSRIAAKVASFVSGGRQHAPSAASTVLCWRQISDSHGAQLFRRDLRHGVAAQHIATPSGVICV